MSNSFEILMNQLGIPTEMRQAPALAQADIERVVVHKISKVWEFHFVFSNILPIEIFLELKKGLREEFSYVYPYSSFKDIYLGKLKNLPNSTPSQKS